MEPTPPRLPTRMPMALSPSLPPQATTAAIVGVRALKPMLTLDINIEHFQSLHLARAVLMAQPLWTGNLVADGSTAMISGLMLHRHLSFPRGKSGMLQLRLDAVELTHAHLEELVMSGDKISNLKVMNQNAKLVVGGLLIYALVKSRARASSQTFTPVLQNTSTQVVTLPPPPSTSGGSTTTVPAGAGICQWLDGTGSWVNAPLYTSPFGTVTALDTQAKCAAADKCSSGGACYRWTITNCNPAYTGPGTYANLIDPVACKWDVQCIPGQQCFLTASATPIKKCMWLDGSGNWVNPPSSTAYVNGQSVDITTEAGCIMANQCSQGGACYEWR